MTNADPVTAFADKVTDDRPILHGALPVTDALDGGGGFAITAHSQAAFDHAVARAMAAWGDAETWRAVQQAGMRRNFGWDAPALTYARLFEALLSTAAR